MAAHKKNLTKVVGRTTLLAVYIMSGLLDNFLERLDISKDDPRVKLLDRVPELFEACEGNCDKFFSRFDFQGFAAEIGGDSVDPAAEMRSEFRYVVGQLGEGDYTPTPALKKLAERAMESWSDDEPFSHELPSYDLGIDVYTLSPGRPPSMSEAFGTLREFESIFRSVFRKRYPDTSDDCCLVYDVDCRIHALVQR